MAPVGCCTHLEHEITNQKPYNIALWLILSKNYLVSTPENLNIFYHQKIHFTPCLKSEMSVSH